MAGLQLSIEIAAPAEQVFAVATDLENWSSTFEDVVSISPITKGPMGVGTKFRETRIIIGRESTEEMEVIAFNPPRGYTLRSESCGAIFVCEHRFAQTPEGTRVAIEITTEPQSLLAKLMAPFSALFTAPVKKAIRADLADLKRVCELNVNVESTLE